MHRLLVNSQNKAVIINPPYDAEIEYLASDGTPYIDTGIECTGDLSVECEVYWSDTSGNSICGGLNNDTDTYLAHCMIPNNNNHNFYWWQTSSASPSSIHFNSGPARNTWHEFYLDGDTGDWKYNSSGGAYTTGSVTPVSASRTTGKNYGIFARIESSGTTSGRSSRWRWCKLKRGGVLLRDFIPVRVGQVGYMYDKVSRQLFGNAGTGSFILGPDIVKDKRKVLITSVQPVYYTYLKFDGNACIQTDVTMPENGSIYIPLGDETLKAQQVAFNFLQGDGSGYIRFGLGGGTNSTNRQMLPYYDSTNYMFSNRTLAWSYSRYDFFMTPKGMGYGDYFTTYTKGSTHPRGGLCIGNYSNSSPETYQGYTGRIKAARVYNSTAQNVNKSVNFSQYTPVSTLQPCKLGNESGLMWMETGIFYRKTGGTGTISVEGDIITL